MIFDVNAIYKIKAYYKIVGWVYVENHDTRGQEAFIQLEKPNGDIIHYPTMPKERPDVGKQRKNKLYNASGFSASIPLNEGLDVGAFTIRLLVKNERGTYKSPAWRAGMRISSRVEIAPLGNESQAVKYYISLNECRQADKFAYQYLVGWVYVENQETQGQEVFVQLEKPDGTILHYSTTSKKRPDVGKSNKSAMYNSSGFVASIPLDNGLDVDDCTIRLLVKNKKGMYMSPAWRAGIRISSRVGIMPPEEESRVVKFYLSVNEHRETEEFAYQYLVGWAYVEDHETRDQKIFVQLEKPDGTILHYSTTSKERPDVGESEANAKYNHSGFVAAIPQDNGLEVDACKIRIVLKNKNGMFISLAWKAGIKYGASSGKLTVFVVVNWLLVIVTAIALFLTIWRVRSLLLKPSIMAILFFHVMCQWGAAIQAGRIELFLPRPWIFVLLSHGFPMIGLAFSLLIGRKSARETWQRIIDPKPANLSGKRRALALLAVFFVLFMIIYLSKVPFRSTGLYSIVFSDASPADSALARERSVTLLDNAFLRYGHNIMMAVFAPLLAVLALQLMLAHYRQRNRLQALFYLGCIAAVLVAASISGARAYSGYIIMFVLFAWLLQKGFPIKPVQLVLAVIVILTLPTMLSILREGKALTVKGFFTYLRGSTLNRVVIVPMVTGLQHVHYAQTYDVFGVQAIPKLAKLRGIKPLDVPNFIARMYYGNPLTTMTANTSYVYAYYSYFGLIAFIPCLLGLWLLDLSLLIYQRLSATMLLPCVACISIAANKFSGTEYTISLFTFGFLFLLLVSWAVDRFVIISESFALKKKR